jgi:hypothetical protein
VTDWPFAWVDMARSAVNPMPSILPGIPVLVIVPEMSPIASRVTSFHLPANQVSVGPNNRHHKDEPGWSVSCQGGSDDHSYHLNRER